MRLTITKYKLTKPKTIFNLFGTNITSVFLSFHYPLLRSNFSATKRNKETKKEKKTQKSNPETKRKNRIRKKQSPCSVSTIRFALISTMMLVLVLSLMESISNVSPPPYSSSSSSSMNVETSPLSSAPSPKRASH